MPAYPTPLLTPFLLGQALPDQVRVSIFMEAPDSHGDVRAMTTSATSFFQTHPGAQPHDDPKDPSGPGYVIRVGDLTCKFNITYPFSMSASFNAQRLAARRAGLPRWNDDDGNTVLPLLNDGYDRAGLRQGMIQDLTDLVAQAKAAYARMAPRALGARIDGVIHGNFSTIELTYDFAVDPSIIPTYGRAFYKLIKPYPGASGLAGCLRKGEGFRIYSKLPVHSAAPVVRFENAISGTRVKELTGSQLVPADAEAVARVLNDTEARYFPVWLEIERHRHPNVGPLRGQLIMKMPNVRAKATLDRVARVLGQKGKVRSGKSNRGVLDSLRRRGLVENPMSKTRVRGYRISTPESEPLWRAWA